MKISLSNYKLIEHLLPKQRGNVKIPNIQVLNAILYVAEHGCKWRGLPKHFGSWHSIYTRANRWAKNNVLDRVFLALQENDVINIQVDSKSAVTFPLSPGNFGNIQKVENL